MEMAKGRPKRLKRQVQFTIDPDLIDGLAGLRARDGASASESVRRALRAYFEAKGVLKGAQKKRGGAAVGGGPGGVANHDARARR